MIMTTYIHTFLDGSRCSEVILCGRSPLSASGAPPRKPGSGSYCPVHCCRWCRSLGRQACGARIYIWMDWPAVGVKGSRGDCMWRGSWPRPLTARQMVGMESPWASTERLATIARSNYSSRSCNVHANQFGLYIKISSQPAFCNYAKPLRVVGYSL